MNSINLPVSFFIIKDAKKWKYSYFYFLCRYFFNFNWFPWWFQKEDFFKHWKLSGYSHSALKRIWADGCAIDNQNIEFVIWKDGSVVLYRLRSHRRDIDERTVRISSKTILQSIQSLPDFKLLCFTVIASRPSKANKDDISKMERKKNNIWYVKLLRSRTLATIWNEFWKSKSAISKLLNRADDKFSFFTISARYTTYHWKIARISNIYSLRGITYHFHRKSMPLAKRMNFWPWYDDGIRTIKPRPLKKKVFTYGKNIDYWKRSEIWKDIFLDREAYNDAYKNLIW